MQEQIASYLFQTGSFPIEGLGTLVITNTAAITDFGTRQLLPPTPVIRLQDAETDSSDFIGYLAATTNNNAADAKTAWSDYCRELRNRVETGTTFHINAVGSFEKDAAGKVVFTDEKIAGGFMPPVQAERVIHPEAEHSILVGDKETTNTEMTEYFSEQPVKKDRWWIWAIVILVVAALVVLFYLSDPGSNSKLGNAINSLLS